MWRGFTLIELVFILIVASRNFWRASAERDSGEKFAILLALVVVVGLLLEVKIAGRSLWMLVYYFVPGGKGVRVVVRYQLILLVVSALVVAVVLDRLLRERNLRMQGLAVVLALALLAEQINLTPIASLSRMNVAAAVAPVPTPFKECRSFYTIHPSPQLDADPIGRKYYIHSTQAMLVAETVGVPTLNGMDTFIPPDNNLFDPLEKTYEARAYLYALRHNLLAGLCTYDLTTKEWRVVTGPPPAPATVPFGSGLLPDSALTFAAGQKGVPSLDQGWSDPESWGVWAIGTQSSLDLKLDATAFSAGAELSLFVQTLLPRSVPQKSVYVEIASADGSQIHATWMVGRNNAVQTICVPSRLLKQHAPLRLNFSAKQSFSPASIGDGDDTRVLNFGLTKLTATSTTCANSLDIDPAHTINQRQ